MAWKVLYGEDYSTIPDPNKPENTAYLKAVSQRRKDDIELFMKGPGRVLFDDLSRELKGLNVYLFSLTDALCSCEACKTIMKMQQTLKLLTKMADGIKGE